VYIKFVITYIKGDAMVPQAAGPKLIVHICNDIGKWGKGFVLAVSKRWPHARQLYLDWYNGKRVDNPTKGKIVLTTGDCELGRVQLVEAIPYDTFVVNMVAQKGVGTGSKGPPIRYDALERCLEATEMLAGWLHCTVHMPRIGTGLAGGKWEKIEPLIEKAFGDRSVYIYDFDG